ncbi:MAG: signal transduction histidine kinase LytS [Chroococcidiopsidaceae cyanobacterium CP_BM_ER_R8_30]|nr:signal transduction histidine kinase LytS [Chroococcidiopsidaceae cyanobacterium CP_BM_ER_R8_30]
MAFGRHQRAVGTFSTRQAAEQALNELRDCGFPMERVTVIGKDEDSGTSIAGAEVKAHVGNQSRTGAGAGAVAGTALGGAGGILLGLGALAIPGAGPFLAAGALATSFAGAGIGAAGGALIGGLVGLGIPEEQAKVYSNSVSRGEYLVIVDGSEEEVTRAASILSNRGIQEWGIYDAADMSGYDQPVSSSTTVTPPQISTSSVNVSPMTSGNTIGTSQDDVEIIDRRTEVR